MKLKNSNFDEIKKKSNCDETQTYMGTKLKNSNYDRSQKLKL